MASMDIIKENIHFQQLLKENNSNTALKDEYVIPDTHPDVKELLNIEGNTIVTNKEISGDKVIIEGRIEYTVLYIPREDNSSINSVNYSENFTSYLNIEEDEHKVICEVECKVEHIEAKIINERKISIEGIVKLNWELYKDVDFDYVKDIECSNQVQVLKKSESISKLTSNKEVELIGKSMIRISMDKPQIERILQVTMNIHKKEIKLAEDKIYLGCYCKVNIIYLGMESQELISLEDDVYISKEEEIVGVMPEMNSTISYEIENKDIGLEDDDLGETRIINIEFLVRANVKIFSSQSIDVIEDAYSPIFPLELKKNEYEIGIVHGIQCSENIIKDNLNLKEGDLKPEHIIGVTGRTIAIEKTITNDRIILNGKINLNIVYRTFDEEALFHAVNGEIPFTVAMEMLGVREEMKSIVKCDVEDIEAFIEANTISVKVTLSTLAKVFYEEKKFFISDAVEGENENIDKNSSVTIYIVNKNDTLWNLAKKYKTTVEELVQLNSIENPDIIYPGEKLIIPGRAIF